MHRAIRHAGFLCFQSYPIKAEMSVSMPLRQAKSPIHLDLIVVCRRESQCQTQNSGELIFGDIVSAAKQQVDSLKRIGIRVSLGDAKVILMGRMLCEIHKMGNPEREEKLLDSIERDIDTFASQVILTEGEILYKRAASGPEQLTLFEELENYLTKNR